VLDAVLLGRLEGPDPLLGERERVRAALVPRPRRRHPNEVEPVREPPRARARKVVRAQELVDLGPAPRRPREERARQLDERRHVEVGRDRVHPPPPLLAGPPDPRREERVVPSRDDVDRLPHQRALDDGAAHEGPVEVVSLELLEARPESDVRVRRVLVLDAPDPLERTREREARALEQELSREKCPVQLALREGALRHPGDASR
jgi:hypothetical protein